MVDWLFGAAPVPSHTIEAAPIPSPSPTVPPTPTPTPAPSVTDDPIVNGYDARQVWDLCKARGVGDNSTNITTEEFTPANVTPAFDGNGVQVLIHWNNNVVGKQIFACAFNGDPASPALYAFDVPHEGK